MTRGGTSGRPQGMVIGANIVGARWSSLRWSDLFITSKGQAVHRGPSPPPGSHPVWHEAQTSYGICRNFVTRQPTLPDRTVVVRESIPSFDGYTLSHPEPGRAGQQSSRGSCCTQSNVLRLRKITGSWSFQRRGMAELRCPRRPFGRVATLRRCSLGERLW